MVLHPCHGYMVDATGFPAILSILFDPINKFSKRKDQKNMISKSRILFLLEHYSTFLFIPFLLWTNKDSRGYKSLTGTPSSLFEKRKKKQQKTKEPKKTVILLAHGGLA